MTDAGYRFVCGVGHIQNSASGAKRGNPVRFRCAFVEWREKA
jgi:hypothetical protein